MEETRLICQTEDVPALHPIIPVGCVGDTWNAAWAAIKQLWNSCAAAAPVPKLTRAHWVPEREEILGKVAQAKFLLFLLVPSGKAASFNVF